MDIKKISVPEVYTDSQDFRFFIDLFTTCLEKMQYDTENLIDLYDPLRCPTDLLWLLADTMGFKYDDRFYPAFNRLVLMYFMSMINYRGSVTGMTLAAETNLASFRVNEAVSGYTDKYGVVHSGSEIAKERLDDPSIPVNSVFVDPHPEDGYIDVVYFATSTPLDACIEYVRPIGMYIAQHAGVRMDARTRIGIDVRLTDLRDSDLDFGPTFVGHYRRADYASLQKMTNPTTLDTEDKRHGVWSRNSKYEGDSNEDINPGYRALSSIQLANGENVIRAMLDPIFSIGYDPQNVFAEVPDDYLKTDKEPRKYNLRYDLELDEKITPKNENGEPVISTLDKDKTVSIVETSPAINPIMGKLGDALPKQT